MWLVRYSDVLSCRKCMWDLASGHLHTGLSWSNGSFVINYADIPLRWNNKVSGSSWLALLPVNIMWSWKIPELYLSFRLVSLQILLDSIMKFEYLSVKCYFFFNIFIWKHSLCMYQDYVSRSHLKSKSWTHCNIWVYIMLFWSWDPEYGFSLFQEAY